MWFYFNVFCFTGVFFIRVVVLLYISTCTCQINVFTLSQEWNWPDSRAQDGRSQSIRQMAWKNCVCRKPLFHGSRWYRVGLLQLKWSAVEKHLASWGTHLKTQLTAECDIICYCNAGGTVSPLLIVPVHSAVLISTAFSLYMPTVL